MMLPPYDYADRLLNGQAATYAVSLPRKPRQSEPNVLRAVLTVLGLTVSIVLLVGTALLFDLRRPAGVQPVSAFGPAECVVIK